MRRIWVVLAISLVAAACGGAQPDAAADNQLRGWDGEVLSGASDSGASTAGVEQPVLALADDDPADSPAAVDPVTEAAVDSPEQIVVETATPENLQDYVTYDVPDGWTARPNELSYESDGYDIEIVENSGVGRVRIVIGAAPTLSFSEPFAPVPWATIDDVRFYVDTGIENPKSEPIAVTVADSPGLSYGTSSFSTEENGVKYQLVFGSEVRLLIIADPSDNDSLDTVNRIVASIERAN